MAVLTSPWATASATVADHVVPVEPTVFPSPWAPADATVPELVRVQWWTITDGQRRPLYARPRLTPAKSRQYLDGKDGTFFPDATNTGHYTPKVNLEEINENVTITQAGTVLRGKWIRGRVSIAAPNVTIDDCLVSGPSTGSASGALVTATNASVRNALITDTEIAPEHPNDRVNCIEGHHLTLQRVNAHHGVDILGIIGQLSDSQVDVKILSSWLHTMVMSNTSTQNDNITHNDLIQWHGLLGLTLIGARLEAFVDPTFGAANIAPTWHPTETLSNGKPKLLSGNPNYPGLWGFSAIMASPARKLMGGFSMDRSWVDGGAVGLNWGGPTEALFPDGGSITDTAFGSDFRLGPEFALLTKSFRSHSISGNHRWNKANPFDTSVAYNPRRNG